VTRQRFCSKPDCRQASKVDAQQRWRQKPDNLDYFKGQTHVERVRQWRLAHPGYWRRKVPEVNETSDALQETLTPKDHENQSIEAFLPSDQKDALQDSFFMQPAVFVGLISHLTGHTLQENIEVTIRRLQQLGGDILGHSMHPQGGLQDAQTTPVFGPTATGAQAVQLGRSARPVLRHALVREHYIDALSHQACTLYLFLLTVADAQGLSYYAEPTLCRRLSMSKDTLRQARQELITRELLAYRRPLYQVLALGAHHTPDTEHPSCDEETLDIKAVFERIWEVLS
jgi:hypothetical protein